MPQICGICGTLHAQSALGAKGHITRWQYEAARPVYTY